MQEKSENFNSLRPILFELCKKNYRGSQIDPPPSRNNEQVDDFLSVLTLIADKIVPIFANGSLLACVPIDIYG